MATTVLRGQPSRRLPGLGGVPGQLPGFTLWGRRPRRRRHLPERAQTPAILFRPGSRLHPNIYSGIRRALADHRVGKENFPRIF